MISAPAWVALAVGFGLRIALIFVTPVASPSSPGILCSYNDEIAHVQYVSHILERGSLPEQVEPITSPGALERGYFENYQPPLSYVITASVCRTSGISGLEGVTRTGRFMSLAFGIGFLFVWLKVARHMNLSSFARDTGVIFLSLSGVVTLFTVTAGNESLAWLFAGLILLYALKLESAESWTAKSLALLTLWTILGLWTKLSVLPLLIVPLATLIRKRSESNPRHVFACLTVILLATLPIWWRNIAVFDSILPLSAGFGDPVWRFPTLSNFVFFIRSSVFPWYEFWQGWPDVLLMTPLLLLFVYAAFRFALSPLRALRMPLLIALTVAAISFFWLNLRYDQAEARYLFVAWPAIVLLLATPVKINSHGWKLVSALLLPYLLFLIPFART